MEFVLIALWLWPRYPSHPATISSLHTSHSAAGFWMRQDQVTSGGCGSVSRSLCVSVSWLVCPLAGHGEAPSHPATAHHTSRTVCSHTATLVTLDSHSLLHPQDTLGRINLKRETTFVNAWRAYFIFRYITAHLCPLCCAVVQAVALVAATWHRSGEGDE